MKENLDEKSEVISMSGEKHPELVHEVSSSFAPSFIRSASYL